MNISLNQSEFVVIEEAKRQLLYGDSALETARVEIENYAYNSLGILHPELIGQFNRRFMESKDGKPSNEINVFNSYFTRHIYQSEATKPFGIYQHQQGDVPVILFDVERANLNPTSLFPEEIKIQNPGYFIGIFSEGEFSRIRSESLDSITNQELERHSRWLKSFDNLIRGEEFGALGIEVVKRKVSDEEVKSLIEYYQKMNSV